ncbi:hypothetical protein HYPSUDRAFT_44096 [Hypholoma sublateritium FD-334 SS-4]|uniref:Uncharacterized protein n=1 Tax=Hypholoma sublateritium (strain FD-334 SS-4) TaxID=945553 RepID=A0A0D2KYF3_HYPSF|nr:hypothetical protein HYPSUDRAFT_44096 [Hypholoma sublateritium FD-334 SS-4]
MLLVNYGTLVASFTIMVQDILANVSSDYHILKLGLNVPFCAYFASRISVIGYLLGSVIYSSELFEY